MFCSIKKLISYFTIAAISLLIVFSVALGDSTTTKTAPATAAVVKTVVPKVKIVDFEGKATLGQLFWMAVTDSVMQGKSKATISIVPDGAAGTKQSLKIAGSVVLASNPYVMFAGAGSRFEGGKVIYDVTSYTGIRFWGKGDGNTYRIDLPAAAVTDFMFHSFSFTPPTGEWKEYKIPFIGFKQMPFGKKVQWTGTDIQGVHFFTVGGPIEKFLLQVDEIEFYK
jgi:hypothetical protein